MRLALIIALSPDRRSGRVLSGLTPADQAIGRVKQAINDGRCPDARFPVLQAVAINSLLREHRFAVTAEEIAAAEASQEGEELDWLNGDGMGEAGWIHGADLIKVELGEDDHKVLISVATEPEADFIRDLASSATGAVAEIEKLRGLLEEARKQVDGLAAANQRLATLEADLVSRDTRIAELESQLAAAKQPPAPAAPEADNKPGGKKPK